MADICFTYFTYIVVARSLLRKKGRECIMDRVIGEVNCDAKDFDCGR